MLKSYYIFLQVLGPYTFKIGDTKNFAAYAKGGICTQVKMPTDVTFKPLKESLENPDPEAMLITDFGKWDRPSVLHIAFQAMHHYKKVNFNILIVFFKRICFFNLFFTGIRKFS